MPVHIGFPISSVPHNSFPHIFSLFQNKNKIKQNKRLSVIIDRHFISIFLSVYVAVFKVYLSKSVPGLLSSRLLICLQATCFFFAWNAQILAMNISHTHCGTTVFNQELIWLVANLLYSKSVEYNDDLFSPPLSGDGISWSRGCSPHIHFVQEIKLVILPDLSLSLKKKKSRWFLRVRGSHIRI